MCNIYYGALGKYSFLTKVEKTICTIPFGKILRHQFKQAVAFPFCNLCNTQTKPNQSAKYGISAYKIRTTTTTQC